MLDFLKTIIDFFNRHSIEYMLSGSVALSVYILPRAIRDFDFIIHLKEQDVDLFVDYFSAKYYCDKDAVIEAVKHKSMFNIIDTVSGLKAFCNS